MKSIILVAENFQDEEFVYPYYKLQEFSEVHVASANGKDKYGKYGVPARGISYSFSQIKGNEYDLVVIPGGFECPDRLRIDEDCLKIVRDAHNANKCIAAICHGPWVLISAGITKGIEMTSYKAVHIDLANSGALLNETENVVKSGNIITAQHYRNNPEFMMEVQTIYKVFEMDTSDLITNFLKEKDVSTIFCVSGGSYTIYWLK